MQTLTSKQLFTIEQALQWMKTRKERISYEFTGKARKAYEDEVKHIDSILDVLRHTTTDLLSSSVKAEEMRATIEVKL